MTRLAIGVGALLLLSSGCSVLNSARVHGRTRDPSQLGVSMPRDSGDVGRSAPGGIGAPTGKSHTSSLDTRRVCRGSSWPSGWIAIGYESSDTECTRAGTAGPAYNVATITRYETQPPGQTMKVCADQSISFGWVEESSDDRRGDACPGAGKDGVSATRLIRRER